MKNMIWSAQNSKWVVFDVKDAPLFIDDNDRILGDLIPDEGRQKKLRTFTTALIMDSVMFTKEFQEAQIEKTRLLQKAADAQKPFPRRGVPDSGGDWGP
jgi:hypothetical protein